jgi:hypothetical protein
MRKILALAAVLLALVAVVQAETQKITVAATATSQTVPLPKPSASLTLCNLGASEVYFRVFDENDTPAAATTAHMLLPAGSAAAPFCVAFSRSVTTSAYYKWVALKCDTAEEATIHVIAE